MFNQTEKIFNFPITRELGDVTAHFEVILKYKFSDVPVLVISIYRIEDLQSGRKQLVAEDDLSDYLMFDNIYQGEKREDFLDERLEDIILGMLDVIINKDEYVKSELDWLESVVDKLSDKD